MANARMAEFKCTECEQSFYEKRYLNAHTKRKHKQHSEETDKIYKCVYCEKVFKSQDSMSKHRRRTHGQYNVKLNVVCQEKNCHETFSSLSNFRNHLKLHHGFENQDYCQEKSFKSKEEFESWLAEEEQKCKSSFVMARGEQKFSSHTTKSYICSRSGHYISHSEGKRQLKAQGSKRIGFHCTSQIVVKQSENSIDVQYFPSHYKHDSLSSHIPLSQEIKNTVAGKLLQGVSDSRIIRDIRGCSTSEGNLERTHIFTRKDLNNIKKDIVTDNHINPSSFDEISIEMWVESMKERKNIILDFKNQDTDHEIIEKRDFFLAFMMPLQLDMFIQFGGDRICVDSTHGISSYGFELVTVMVIDEYEEGFPVAFCVTSTVNFKSMQYFFKKLKNTLPEEIKTRVFMSDDAPFFYQAWESIFGPVKVHLLCAWHVDRAWQGHLISIPLEKRRCVYKVLKSITYELDEETFHKTLSQFLTELEKDCDTKNFHLYFTKYYASRKEMWAYCYRKGAKLNTNMHLEHFHREIKHIYLEGKKCKRVDKCCESLQNYITDKQFERLIKHHKGKITKKHTDSYHRHKEGQNIISNCQQISQDKWVVKSTTFPSKTYTVQKTHACTNTCNIICRECVCCMSAYECTCHDFSILNNLCKHIHAVNQSSEMHTAYSGPLHITPSSKTTLPNTNTLTDNVTSNSEISKEHILNKINALYSKIQSKSSIHPDMAKQIMNSLNSVDHLLNINIPVNIITNNPREPANKKIIPQKRFFSTKKQKAQKKQKLNKPSKEEQLNTENILLNKPYISINSNNDHNYI